MSAELEKWADESPQNRRLYAQEGLILKITEEIWSAMERRGINKQNLAEKLGTGKSHVSQLLNGGRNMTLRTLADIAGALNQHIEIMFHNSEEEALWKPMGRMIRAEPLPTLGAVAANENWTYVSYARPVRLLA